MFMNYAGITVRSMLTKEHSRELILDDTGIDALYVRHAFSVLGLINGQKDFNGNLNYISMTDYEVPSRDDPNVPVAPTNLLRRGLRDGPNHPPLTDKLILESLMTPRQKLLVYSVGPDNKVEVILESPGPNRRVDARNGPTPLRADIVDHHAGDNTWTVNFQIETYQPVCPSGAALLSNRYKQVHSADQDYRLTIETEGVAVFRHDALLERTPPINPDELRQYLAVPIPPGFKRDGIRVWHQGDIVTIGYAFTDVQQPWVFVGGRQVHGTRIVTNFTQAITASGDKLEGVLGGIERGLNLKWLRGHKSGTPKPPDITPAFPAPRP